MKKEKYLYLKVTPKQQGLIGDALTAQSEFFRHNLIFEPGTNVPAWKGKVISDNTEVWTAVNNPVKYNLQIVIDKLLCRKWGIVIILGIVIAGSFAAAFGVFLGIYYLIY